MVATDVYGYESGKVAQEFFTRPQVGKSAYALVQRAKFEAKQEEWLERLSSKPRVFVAPIAAGEKVVASKHSDIFQFLRASYNDAIAVEMEGFGFLSATFAYPNIKAIVIRGISDLIEGKNDDSIEPEEVRQKKASDHASAFAFQVLSKFQTTKESLKIEPQLIEQVKMAIKPERFPSYKALATELGIALSTVGNFLKGNAVDYLNFVAISEKLKLDWQEIVAKPDDIVSSNKSGTLSSTIVANNFIQRSVYIRIHSGSL